MKVWKVLAGSALLASCSVPGLGPVSQPPEAKTAPESPLISQVCRDALGPAGQDTLNAADAQLASPNISSEDAQAIVESVVWGAEQTGITSCSAVPDVG